MVLRVHDLDKVFKQVELKKRNKIFSATTTLRRWLMQKKQIKQARPPDPSVSTIQFVSFRAFDR